MTIGYLLSRLRAGIARHGLLQGALRAPGAAWRHYDATRQRRACPPADYEGRLAALRERIEAHRGFVDLFHVPMGWNTPLFQRFQHMSLQAARLGGLAIYGGHPLVDKEMVVYREEFPDVLVFDATDDRVTAVIFDALIPRRGAKILRLQSIDLVTTADHVARFVEQGFSVVYEYIDEISEAITGNVPELVRHRHAAVLRDERVTVVATADRLFEHVKALRTRNCLLSTNGVDLAHWRRSDLPIPDELADVRASGRLVVGYHGALAKWIDYPLLRRIADDGRFELVLIGHEHDDTFASSGLKTHPRVHFLGSRTYFDLNRYCSHYDVAILPFVRSELTESVSPVKLFEYMAAGKPVITSDIRECRKYRSCLVSASEDEFMNNLVHAVSLRQDASYRALLAADAEANSWGRKAQDVFEMAGARIRRKS